MDIWYEASLIAHPFLTKEFMEKDRENIIKTCLPEAEIWVCESEKKVAGFIAMFGSHIGGLFVKPDMQRQGIGTALVDHASTIKGSGTTVEVFKDNVVGRSFYGKYGFNEIFEFIHPDSSKPVIHMKCYR